MTGKLFFSLSTDCSTRTMNSLGFPVLQLLTDTCTSFFTSRLLGPLLRGLLLQLKNVRFFIIYVFLSCSLVCKALVNYQKLRYMITYCLQLPAQLTSLLPNSDRRLADHFGGKLHMGYMLIRERLSELQVSFCRSCDLRSVVQLDTINFTEFDQFYQYLAVFMCVT